MFSNINLLLVVRSPHPEWMYSFKSCFRLILSSSLCKTNWKLLYFCHSKLQTDRLIGILLIWGAAAVISKHCKSETSVKPQPSLTGNLRHALWGCSMTLSWVNHRNPPWAPTTFWWGTYMLLICAVNAAFMVCGLWELITSMYSSLHYKLRRIQQTSWKLDIDFQVKADCSTTPKAEPEMFQHRTHRNVDQIIAMKERNDLFRFFFF